jgi:diguanylate cyclase (GGDEF)-like protein
MNLENMELLKGMDLLDIFIPIFNMIITYLIIWNYNVRANSLQGLIKTKYLQASIFSAAIFILVLYTNAGLMVRLFIAFLLLPIILFMLSKRHPLLTMIEMVYFFVIDIYVNFLIFLIYYFLDLTYFDFQENFSLRIITSVIYLFLDWLHVMLLHKRLGSKVYEVRDRIWNKQKNGTKVLLLFVIVVFAWLTLTAYIGTYAIYNISDISEFTIIMITCILSIMILIILATITYQKNMFDQLHQESVYDELTNAMNRKFGLQYIETLLKKNKEHVVLCYVDLNSLKKINDELGHQYGDDLIRFQIGMIRETIGEQATIIRMGGDEFVLVFPSETLEFISDLMETSLKKIDQGKPSCYEGYPTSFSYGCIEYQKDQNIIDPMDLISKADQAMYEYKRRFKENLSLDRTSSIQYSKTNI